MIFKISKVKSAPNGYGYNFNAQQYTRVISRDVPPYLQNPFPEFRIIATRSIRVIIESIKFYYNGV
jgi:hypothetical protein